MSFQHDPNLVEWRLHLASPPEAVYQMLATDEGRARFWAESAPFEHGAIAFTFPNGATWRGAILKATPPHRFTVYYYGGTVAAFELASDSTGGTDLRLAEAGVPDEDREEVIAGWVSVLLALKAAVDFGVDLRNHYPERTWDQRYVEN